MSDLPVPDTSLRELNSLVETVSGGEVLHGSREDVHRIAAPVVAAAFRALADELNAQRPAPSHKTPEKRGLDFGLLVAVKTLQERADQLDRDGDEDGDTDA